LHLPLISPYGFTNEKEAILLWLSKNNICPMTKQRLSSKDLRLNVNVYNSIHFLLLMQRYNKSLPGSNALDEIKIKELLD
jgi:hypothetical protein